ncbi:MAG: MOSC N-terminal beta barrel domain-containing protein [Actinomycetes bacterium]
MTRGNIVGISRFPVKSLVGEEISTARVDRRGIVGDRAWAVRDGDGKLGSGKSTRRFRRMPGLLDLRARYDVDMTPIVDFPDGARVRGDQPEIHEVLSDHVGRPVTLALEDGVSHFDEGLTRGGCAPTCSSTPAWTRASTRTTGSVAPCGSVPTSSCGSARR